MKTNFLFEALYLSISKLALILCCFFNKNSTLCQVPDLGACNNFAVFSAAGAIDNTGTTTIEGNIGTNVGAFNGFPPGQISGEIHNVDTESAQAAIDIDVLYSYFSELTCDSTIIATLGNNQTLTPKTYCIGSAATLEDTLIFDGQNHPDALFIFKINGAFSTSTYSTIILINEATAKNIYWQVNGLSTLGDFSDFKGNLVTNGAINLLSNSNSEGRMLTRAGAISLASNKVLMNFNDNPLPIELLSFEANCNELTIFLNWSKASESNNAFFTIEESFDLISWSVLRKIEGAGNSSHLIEYSTTIEMENDSDLSYLRLKQTDFDGHFRNSKTIILEGCSVDEAVIKLYPNPVNNVISIESSNNWSDFQSLSICKSSGELVFTSTIPQPQIDMQHYPSGMYYFKFVFYNSQINKRVSVLH